MLALRSGSGCCSSGVSFQRRGNTSRWWGTDKARATTADTAQTKHIRQGKQQNQVSSSRGSLQMYEAPCSLVIPFSPNNPGYMGEEAKRLQSLCSNYLADWIWLYSPRHVLQRARTAQQTLALQTGYSWFERPGFAYLGLNLNKPGKCRLGEEIWGSNTFSVSGS